MADSNPVGPEIGMMQAMEPQQQSPQSPQPQPTPQPAPQQQGIGGMFPVDDDTEGRKQRWEGFFEKISQEPGAASFLTQLGAGLMQPLGPGDTAMGQLGQAASGAMQGQQQMAQQQSQQEARQAQEERADQQLGLQERQFEENKRQFEAAQDMEMRKALLDQLGEEGGDGEGGMDRETSLDMANDIVSKQMERDRTFLGEEEFGQKWGGGRYMENLRAIASQLSGKAPEQGQDRGVPFTGQQLLDAGVEEMEGVDEIDPNETYQMPTSWVQENFQGRGGQESGEGQQQPQPSQSQQAGQGDVPTTILGLKGVAEATGRPLEDVVRDSFSWLGEKQIQSILGAASMFGGRGQEEEEESQQDENEGTIQR